VSPAAPTLVVLDVDGTLVDSEPVIVAAMQTAFEAHGLSAPAAHSVRRVVGLSLPQAMAVLVPEAADDDHHALTERYRTAFAALRAGGAPQGTLFPGAEAALGGLAEAGHLLGVATGKSRRGLVATLERFGLGERFVTLQTSDDAPSKPHPAMVEQAMGETGAVPETTVLVGDTTYDMAMAGAAGAAAIGVAWGYHEPAELREAGARQMVERFDELVGAVEAVLGRRRWR
jgi:phosphoglycolate phosphatase